MTFIQPEILHLLMALILIPGVIYLFWKLFAKPDKTQKRILSRIEEIDEELKDLETLPFPVDERYKVKLRVEKEALQELMEGNR